MYVVCISISISISVSISISISIYICRKTEREREIVLHTYFLEIESDSSHPALALKPGIVYVGKGMQDFPNSAETLQPCSHIHAVAQHAIPRTK